MGLNHVNVRKRPNRRTLVTGKCTLKKQQEGTINHTSAPAQSVCTGRHTLCLQDTWNALPLHPTKSPQLPPTNCSGHFLSAVFLTGCEKNTSDGKGGGRTQANSQLSPLSSKHFFKYHLFLRSTEEIKYLEA